jgi:hypothetical protein
MSSLKRSCCYSGIGTTRHSALCRTKVLSRRRASVRDLWRSPFALLPERVLAVHDGDGKIRGHPRRIVPIDEVAGRRSLTGQHVDQTQDRFGVVDVELDLRIGDLPRRSADRTPGRGGAQDRARDRLEKSSWSASLCPGGFAFVKLRSVPRKQCFDIRRLENRRRRATLERARHLGGPDRASV